MKTTPSSLARARHSATRLERRRRRRDGGRRRASFPDHAPASRSAPTRARPRAWRVTQMPRHQPTITPAGRLVSTRGRCRSPRASPVAARAAMATRRTVPRPASRCSSARVHDSSASTPSEPEPSKPRASPDRCKGGGGPSDGFPETDSTALALLPRSTPLTPLMDRLRTPKRVFAYPDLNVELTITQGWDESGAGTGAAVWDSAERLARCVAETGALSALRQHPTAALHVRDVDDARAWWRGKTVVELGAGLGLTSLVAASAGALALCTDGDDRVVRMCAENARANASNVRARAPRTNARRRVDASRLTPRDSCGATRMMRVPPRIGFEPRTRRARSRRSKARSRRSKAVRVRVRLRRRRIPRSSYWPTWCTVNGLRVGGRWWGRFDAWRGRRRSWRCRTREEETERPTRFSTRRKTPGFEYDARNGGWRTETA